jgi:hypothetical protein
LEVRAHDIESLHRHRILNGIEGLVAFLAIHNSLMTPQNHEVLGKICLFEARLLLDDSR